MKLSHFSRVFCNVIISMYSYNKKSARRETVLKAFIYAVLRQLCYQPHKPFRFVTAVCTVLLLILKTFAVALTVAPVSNIYSPSISALSCVTSFIQSTPQKRAFPAPYD